MQRLNKPPVPVHSTEHGMQPGSGVTAGARRDRLNAVQESSLFPISSKPPAADSLAHCPTSRREESPAQQGGVPVWSLLGRAWVPADLSGQGGSQEHERELEKGDEGNMGAYLHW
ncbi:hypothetical protein AAFF_G00209200 [Aldrovandia affinis]|uniref:Uncharacterized protein n=1 Tax=Aldrovandia affinis TaxID=143900 RepID=A0AAD7SW33_9TELE|nr:hypothetical protein AAFF_G00209200 [Aldrovandia affinis]